MPKVLSGTWDPKAGEENLAAADKDFDAAYLVMMDAAKSPEDGLEAFARFAAKWPAIADNVYMIQSKLGLRCEPKNSPMRKCLPKS